MFAHTDLKITVQSVFVQVKTFNRQLEINFREQGKWSSSSWNGNQPGIGIITSQMAVKSIA